jgi:hypothetical protein
VQLSIDQFSDKRFGEFFYRTITKDIEKTNQLLNSLLDYVRVTTPLRRTGTVHTLIEGVLKKYRTRLDEKKIRVSWEFEKDLPETTVPDEQLRYILDSVVQYALTVMPGKGSLEFQTKSVPLQRERGDDQTWLEEDRKVIQLSVFFSGVEKPGEAFGPRGAISVPEKEESLNFQLLLIDAIAKRNHGKMKVEVEVDEKKAKTSIMLRFPAERRKIVYYPANRP